MIIDADAIAREVVEPGTPGLRGRRRARSATASWRGRLAGPCRAGRDRLRRRRRPARDLNAIVHPLVGERSAELIGAGAGRTRSSSTTSRCWSRPTWRDGFDVVVVVEAPAELRLERLAGARAWPPSRRPGPDGRAGERRAAPRGRRRDRSSTTARRDELAGGGRRASGSGCRPRAR